MSNYGQWVLDIQDIKEKLLLLGITVGIFLPVRLFFGTFVSEYWIGSLGMVSAFALLFIYLIKKNKLGFVGRIFEKQMKKMICGKTGKYIITISFIFLIYFGASLVLIDRGNSVYFYDKQILYWSFQQNDILILEKTLIGQLEGPAPLGTNLEGFAWLSNIEYTLSLSLALMDDVSEGLLSSLVLIVFIEQMEVLGIIFLFRKQYNTKIKTQ